VIAEVDAGAVAEEAQTVLGLELEAACEFFNEAVDPFIQERHENRSGARLGRGFR
jgi:hypothetical protein